MSAVATNAVELLKQKSLSVSSAESCTGGMISQLITSVSGASNVFSLGVCTYSAKAKHDVLGVNYDTVNTFGIVSRETAEEMAKGIMKLACSDMGISTTGYAGPSAGGGLPIGTVCIGFASHGFVYSEKHIFEGNREEVRTKAAERALNIIIKYINGELI